MTMRETVEIIKESPLWDVLTTGEKLDALLLRSTGAFLPSSLLNTRFCQLFSREIDHLPACWFILTGDTLDSRGQAAERP